MGRVCDRLRIGFLRLRARISRWGEGRAAGDRGGGGAQERCGRHDTVTEASPIDDLLPVVVAAAL
jgi:hypothetical protein